LDFEAWQPTDWQRFAIEFELQANPVWPMPQAKEVLRRLDESALKLGIVSNAQFYTPIVLEHLLGQTLTDIGFDDLLRYFSFQYRSAKPGPELFRAALQQLELCGIQANEAVYVGNDMLNDITAAAQAGLRTILFAGDSRSLRLRGEDPRVAGVQADAVITELSQLDVCLGTGDSNQP
jgi:putative hydrolase of the HAD superfamily